jgi:hypothetical protein
VLFLSSKNISVTVLRRPANRPDAQLLESATVVWLRQSWTTVVELGSNNSRTRVGVAELSAGRVAWARDAEAMSRLGNYSDFVL